MCRSVKLVVSKLKVAANNGTIVIITTTERILPAVVCGVTSPYPTVVAVATAQYREIPVDRCSTAEKMNAATMSSALAMQIAQASPLTVGIGKQAFYAQIDLDQGKAYDYTKEVMSLNAMAADAQEGIGAFLDKRKPVWCGR